MLPLIYHPIYSELPLPEGHRYPIMKYRLLFEAIKSDLDSTKVEFVEPAALTLDDIKKSHSSDYVEALASGQLPAPKMRRIGFPWSESLIERTLTSTGGTVETALQAIDKGVAIHLSGGYHHAHHDFGSGFCLFNDLAIAAHKALEHADVDKVLIIDSDVHQGDGTATICSGNPDIITLSFHCDKNFPARKPSSDLDIEFARETQDEEFMQSFTSVVELAISLHQPDMIIYDAGVDIHVDDELGYLNISTQGIYQRDCFMFSLAKRKQIPIAAVVGGGYRSNHSDLVPIHMQLIRAAIDTWE
ncbi:histone deacetylase [Vibrio ishigakensis]|uniref:Histone deacetylase n=1 Tax=Vibrio ishigakensis TaxID=1481914 RepID=A0A0B8P1D4_9VIBR|nr:histone deacetylase [Vibrio ishigakensis]